MNYTSNLRIYDKFYYTAGTPFSKESQLYTL